MKTKQHLLFAALLLSCVTAGSLASHSFNSAENSNSSENNIINVNHDVKKASSGTSETYSVVEGLSAKVLQVNTTPTSAAVKLVLRPTGDEKSKDKNYTIGYATDREHFDPAILTYYVQLPSSQIVKRFYEIPKQTNSVNDIVSDDSPTMLGSDVLDVLCDIPLAPGEIFVVGINSGDPTYPLEISNIYELTSYVKCENASCGKTILSSVEECPYCHKHQSFFDGTENKKETRDIIYEPTKDENGNYIKGKIGYSFNNNLKEAKLSDFILYKYVGRSKFNGVGSAAFELTTKLDLKTYGQFLKSKSITSYREFNNSKKAYERGEYELEVKVTFNDMTEFHVTYEDGTKDSFYGEKGFITIPNQKDGITQIVVYHEKLNKKFVDLTIDKFVVNANTVDATSNARTPVKLLDLSYEYQGVNLGMKKVSYVQPDGTERVLVGGPKNSYDIDSNLVVGITSITFVILYEAVSIFVYFYWKNKYKDDVFRRMRTKPYWTNNTMGLVASGSLLISLISIILRATILNNSMEVYNSIDILIVVFSISAIIFCGYFIKYFAVQIKNIKDKRMNDRLHLDKDKDDDGTLIVSSK